MTERRAQDPPSPRDAEITLLLQDVAVPDHRRGFWDDLARQMEQTDQLSSIGPALGDHEAGADAEPAPAPELVPSGPRSIAPLAWRLLAAAVVLALVGGVALLRTGPDDGQRVDSGVTTTTDTEGSDPEPASTGDPATTSTARGEQSWLLADEIMWIDDEFVTSGFTNDRDEIHWTSPDGIDWQRRNGLGTVLGNPSNCPPEITCEVAPDTPVIPFHFADSGFQTVARAGDVVLLEAWTQYDIEGRPVNADAEIRPDQGLHPDLLAAAASSDRCFAEFARQTPAEMEARQVSIDGYSWGGIDNPVITLTCVDGSDSAVFELDLRDHLDDAQIEAAYSSIIELWVESPGSPPQRVDEFPTTSFWVDGVVGGELSTFMSPVSSSGDRFWALDEGTLVSSTNGTDWTVHEVPTARSEIDGMAAGPGGHLALVLVEDRQVWTEEGHVIVSHDAGSTWSEPVPITFDGFVALAVGPAGAAVSSPSYDNRSVTLTFMADGRTSVATTVDDPREPGSTEVAAVGAEQVLVRSHQQMDVYGLDGTLLHRATWAPGRDGGFDVRWGLAAAAAVALALVALARRRRGSPVQLP